MNEIELEGLAQEIEARLSALPRLDTESVRAVRREYSRRLRSASPQEVVALARRLLRDPGSGRRFLAYELVAGHRPALRSLGEHELEALGTRLDSWEAVDSFATTLAGPAWREHQVPDELIERWAQSPDRWWRRAALVSTVALNTRARGGRGDVPRTLAICCMLAADHDDMVVKAMSWALRELILYDPQAVESFLEEYRPVLAARVQREVRNKLATGLKNPRKKGSGIRD